MKIATIGAAALLVAASGLAPADAAAIKTGRWQFTTQLQSGAAQAAAGAKATYTSCIKSDNAVPAELGPQCKLDRSEHHGERFTWSMTCSNAQSKVRSDGVAQYHGETMEATMVSRLPGAGGQETHMTQHITGRYVGPCLQAADMPMTPSHPTAAPAAASKGAQNGSVAPKPANDAATKDAADRANSAEDKPATATDAEKETASAPERHAKHRREARRHHRNRHYASPGGWYGGSAPYYSGFGPAPYSNSGP